MTASDMIIAVHMLIVDMMGVLMALDMIAVQVASVMTFGSTWYLQTPCMYVV